MSKINSKSLKEDILKYAKDLESEMEAMKERASALALKVMGDCCSDSHEYIAELDKHLDLGITLDGYLAINVNLPLANFMEYNNGTLKIEDVKLTIKDVEVKVTDLTDLDLN